MFTRYNGNIIAKQRPRSLIMYIDMNSYFASCEQQLRAELRHKPIGVCPYPGSNAVVIAASREAKKAGIKTGMLVSACKALCPDFVMVPTRPVAYRRIHVKIMNILLSYCNDVIPKSIDEAVVDLTHYAYVHKDVIALAKQIKKDIAEQIGTHVTCSIGIAANVFLAKLATEIQKPDGLICLTPENLDTYLARMQLTDLPGIARANERRLNRAGITTPLEMRNASEALLRKVFGGVTGNYWYYRLHFGEVDLYTWEYKRMSAMRSLSAATRSSRNGLMSMLVSLCTRLEQRMVKQDVFCREIYFFASYYNDAPWKTSIKPGQPLQDALEMIRYIELRMTETEKQLPGKKIFRSNMMAMGVVIGDFISAAHLQYNLFDNRIQKDKLRKVMYAIKDRYGKNSVRKASETIQPGQMKDAIGFGSVKDLYESEGSSGFNAFLLEDDPEMANPTEAF